MKTWKRFYAYKSVRGKDRLRVTRRNSRILSFCCIFMKLLLNDWINRDKTDLSPLFTASKSTVDDTFDKCFISQRDCRFILRETPMKTPLLPKRYERLEIELWNIYFLIKMIFRSKVMLLTEKLCIEILKWLFWFVFNAGNTLIFHKEVILWHNVCTFFDTR